MRLRARDVEQVFRTRGAEKGALYCIQVLADEISALKQENDELTKLITQAIQLVGLSSEISSNIADSISRMRGDDIDAPEINPHDKHMDEGVDTDPDKGGH